MYDDIKISHSAKKFIGFFFIIHTKTSNYDIFTFVLCASSEKKFYNSKLPDGQETLLTEEIKKASLA